MSQGPSLQISLRSVLQPSILEVIALAKYYQPVIRKSQEIWLPGSTTVMSLPTQAIRLGPGLGLANHGP